MFRHLPSEKNQGGEEQRTNQIRNKGGTPYPNSEAGRLFDKHGGGDVEYCAH